MAKNAIRSAQQRSSSSRKKPASLPTRDRDILAVSIPTSAFTFDGFRAWRMSEEFPEFVRMSYLGSVIHVELDPECEGIEVPVSASTLEGFHTWTRSKAFPQRGRISFLGQEVFIDMSPENLTFQNKVKAETTYVLTHLVRAEDLGRFYIDGAQLLNSEADLSTEPDGTFASWASLTTGRVREVLAKGKNGGTTALAGTPDWVLEIVSHNSVRKDTKVLREKYHRAGIAEYWLIDVRGDRLSFQILQHRSSGYVAVPRRDGWQKSRVFGRSFRLERQRDRLGDWTYSLLVKPA